MPDLFYIWYLTLGLAFHKLLIITEPLKVEVTCFMVPLIYRVPALGQ